MPMTGLPETTSPSNLPEGECPWHRYARASQDPSAYRHRATMRSVMEALAGDVPDDGRCDAVAVLTHGYPTQEVLTIAVSVIMTGTDTTRNQLALGLHLFADCHQPTSGSGTVTRTASDPTSRSRDRRGPPSAPQTIRHDCP